MALRVAAYINIDSNGVLNDGEGGNRGQELGALADNTGEASVTFFLKSCLRVHGHVACSAVPEAL